MNLSTTQLTRKAAISVATIVEPTGVPASMDNKIPMNALLLRIRFYLIIQSYLLTYEGNPADNDKAENSCHKYRQNFLTGHGCHCKTGSEVLQILLGLMNAGADRTILSGTVMILFLCDIEKRRES